MGKTPAFLLYAADFYMDTNTWTTHEIGIYTRLLFSEWVNGPLPNDPKRLSIASGCTIKAFLSGWCQVKSKFSLTEDNKLYNDRLEFVRSEQKEYQEKQKVKGQKSAAKRWHKDVTTVITTDIADAQPEGNLSSSSSNIESINTLLSAERTSCPHQKIIEAYNSILGSYLPRVKPHLWKGKRAKWLATRWKERESRQSIEWWVGLFERIKGIPFLIGKNNRQWTPDLEWIVKEENFVKILEGKYERGTIPGNGQVEPRMVDGVLSGSGNGEKPHPELPEKDGGEGPAQDTIQVAGDGGRGHGDIQEGH